MIVFIMGSGDRFFSFFASHRKRNREEEDTAGNMAGSACLIGQAPKFSRQKEGTSGET